jgi:hypothetical protein
MVWTSSYTVPAGGSGAVFFNSIPQNFTHLQVRLFVRSQNASPNTSMYIAGGPSSHYLVGDGSSVTSTAQTGLPYQFVGAAFPAATSTANVYSNYVIDLLDYTSTSKNKTWRILGGFDANGSGRVTLASGLWETLSAITSFFVDTEGGFAAGTRFDLYGITTSQVTGA